jgi:hypothetical protein
MKAIKTFENFLEDEKMMRIELEPQSPGIEHDEQHEAENYMFFGNLETIYRLTGIMLKMDPLKVDRVLKDGHNWAVDHIVSSKDDIEEVANFLINELTENEPHEMDENSNPSCDECGSVYEKDTNSAVCESCGAPLNL